MAEIFAHFSPDEEKIAYEERYADGYKTIWECYSPEFPEPATRWNSTFYSRQVFVGWSGLGPIALLIENVLGISVDGRDNLIRWGIHRLDRHGIENIQLRDGIISLEARPNGDSMIVEIKADSNFLLEIDWKNRHYTEKISSSGLTSIRLR